MNEKELQTVVLAGLLHDIGKFWQRTGSMERREHPELSSMFVSEFLGSDWDDVANIVANHHLPNGMSARNPALTLTITLADWLSSGERRQLEEGETGKPAQDALISIFSTLNNSENYTYFPLTELKADGNIKPTPTSKVQWADYPQLWERFTQEARYLKALDFSLLINRLLALLEKYTLFIPAAAYKTMADISLFHHLKSTAAIAACLYLTGLDASQVNRLLDEFATDKVGEDEPVAYLIGGDLSGIQDFIYNLRHEGALKGLRGRSLYLQLISEAVTSKILDQLALTRANLISCGGGHFYILASATSNFQSRLNEIGAEVDEILLTAHRGRLSITLASKPVKVQDFKLKNFGKLWDELHNQLAENKRRRFAKLFSAGRVTQVIGPTGMAGEEPACNVCGEETPKEIARNNICPICDSFAQLGRELHRAQYLIEQPASGKIGAYPRWDEVLAAIGRRYSFSRELPTKNNSQSFALNTTEFAPGISGFRFLARYVPQRNGETAELTDIAEQSEGIKRWGVLRADVDNLGKTFKEGLGRENRSISRISMLSYLIGYFFSARVQALAQTEDFKESIYLAYSGGDDLFVIGAWSKLPEFARLVYEEFQQFTSNRLTLSAGIFVAPAEKFPVYEAGEMAGKEEERAKGHGRNSLAFLYESVKWDEYPSILKVKEKLVHFLKNEGPRSLLTVLNSSWEQYQSVEKGETPLFPIWRLLYAFNRLKQRVKDNPVLLNDLDELEKMVIQNTCLHPHLGLIVRWAELETRKTKEG